VPLRCANWATGRIKPETLTAAVPACQHSLPILRNFRRDILAREIDIYRRMEQVDKQTSLRLPPYLGYPAGSRLQCLIYGSRKQSEDGHLRIAFERLQGEPQTARRYLISITITNPVSVLQKTHCIPITNTNRPMLFSKVTAMYCYNYVTHINVLSNFKTGSTYTVSDSWQRLWSWQEGEGSLSRG